MKQKPDLSFWKLWNLSFGFPMLTTVEQRGVRVGEEAANILIGHVEGTIPLDHAEKRIVRTRLIIRGTTR